MTQQELITNIKAMLPRAKDVLSLILEKIDPKDLPLSSSCSATARQYAYATAYVLYKNNLTPNNCTSPPLLGIQNDHGVTICPRDLICEAYTALMNSIR